MKNEYILKEEALEIVRQAYQCYLPQTHGVIMFIENGIANLKPADVREVVHGMWIHTKRHAWRKDRNGRVDTFACESDFHNGPVCTICFETPCVHCKPDWEDLENCEQHYICSHCGEYSMQEVEFCKCGAKMDMDEEENK